MLYEFALCDIIFFVAHSWPVVVLAMTGKFFNSIAFNLLYIVSSEVYSTNMRGLGLSSSSTCARIGATVGVYAGLLVRTQRCLYFSDFGDVFIETGKTDNCLTKTLQESLPFEGPQKQLPVKLLYSHPTGNDTLDRKHFLIDNNKKLFTNKNAFQ